MSHNRKEKAEKRAKREAKRRSKFRARKNIQEGMGDFGGSPSITKRKFSRVELGQIAAERSFGMPREEIAGMIGVGGKIKAVTRGAKLFRGSKFAGAGNVARSRPGFNSMFNRIPKPLKRAAQIGLAAGAGALLEETIQRAAGEGNIFPFGNQAPSGGTQLVPHKDAGRSLSTLPGVGGLLPQRDMVVKVWTTGTANFARLVDGRIAVQKKDGTIKTYRPQKHIVIPRNPRVGTLIRADKRLKRLTKGLRKVVK